MKAGQLRHLITLKAPSDVTDAIGGTARTWSAYSRSTDLWARIQPVSGKERMEWDQSLGTLTHRVTIRYIRAVDVGNQVHYGTRVFEVMSVVDPDERGISLQLMCKERPAVSP